MNVAGSVGPYRERADSKISALKLPSSIFSQCFNIGQRKKGIPKSIKQHGDNFFLFKISEYLCSVYLYLVRKIFSKKSIRPGSVQRALLHVRFLSS